MHSLVKQHRLSITVRAKYLVVEWLTSKMTKQQVPPEFKHMADRAIIPWDNIFDAATKRIENGLSHFEAFTDTVIEIASKESMKKTPEPSIIKLLEKLLQNYLPKLINLSSQ